MEVVMVAPILEFLLEARLVNPVTVCIKVFDDEDFRAFKQNFYLQRIYTYYHKTY